MQALAGCSDKSECNKRCQLPANVIRQLNSEGAPTSAIQLLWINHFFWRGEVPLASRSVLRLCLLLTRYLCLSRNANPVQFQLNTFSTSTTTNILCVYFTMTFCQSTFSFQFYSFSVVTGVESELGCSMFLTFFSVEPWWQVAVLNGGKEIDTEPGGDGLLGSVRCADMANGGCIERRLNKQTEMGASARQALQPEETTPCHKDSFYFFCCSSIAAD